LNVKEAVTRVRLALLILVAATAIGAMSAPDSSAGAPPGLSPAGQRLWQFEALLNDTFHSRVVSAHGSASTTGFINFACRGFCAPLSYWSPYLFTFTGARHSIFHLSNLSAKRIAGTFGNYPVLVVMKGHPVACDRHERRFLITYGDAVGLSLDCLPHG
jgi:hypothetical protein